MAGFSPDAHWRDSARSPRFFLVDARAAFPLLFFLMHIKMWTAIMVAVSAVFFGALEHYGFSIPIFFRWLRLMLAGNRKLAHPWWGRG